MAQPGSARLRLESAIGLVGGWRGVRWLLTGIGLLVLALVVFGVIPYDLYPNDSHAYWVVDVADPYRNARLGGVDAFLYAPAVAQLLAPFTHLPFEAFRLVLGTVSLGALALAGAAYTILAPGVIEDLVRGNIHVLLAAAIIASFRWPGLWAAVLLTKVTPGVGVLWFALRREWRALGQVVFVTALIVAVSVALGGLRLWEEWIRLLATSAESPRTYTYLGVAPPPLLVRMPLAIAVVAWGALTDRRWTVPVAAFLALPVIWPSGFALLAAVPPLVIGQWQSRKNEARGPQERGPEAPRASEAG
jgi:Glycosyltransferase family 87